MIKHIAPIEKRPNVKKSGGQFCAVKCFTPTVTKAKVKAESRTDRKAAVDLVNLHLAPPTYHRESPYSKRHHHDAMGIYVLVCAL